MVSYPRDKGDRLTGAAVPRRKRGGSRNKTGNGYRHLTEPRSSREKKGERERERVYPGWEQQNQCNVNVCRLATLSPPPLCVQSNSVASFPFPLSLSILLYFALSLSLSLVVAIWTDQKCRSLERVDFSNINRETEKDRTIRKFQLPSKTRKSLFPPSLERPFSEIRNL